MLKLFKICNHAVIAITIITLIGISFTLSGQGAFAQEHGHHGEAPDVHNQHDHHYPARGGYVAELPHGHRVIVHGGVRFFYHEGVWYRADGPRFVIVAPPVGILVPALPPYYSTIWVGGVPYYYANDAYYVQQPDGYMVVDPPPGSDYGQPGIQTGTPAPVVVPAPASGPLTSDRVFIYPRQGQGEQQQAKDQ
jgi:hypothetical protein